MSNNTPASIFELGQMIPEVRQFIDLWQHGRLDWNTCLLEMHKALVSRCLELNDSWKIGLDISEKMFTLYNIERPRTFAEAAIHDYCKLQQQESVIRYIHIIANVYFHLEDAAKDRIRTRHISQIMCYKDGRREFHYSDGHVEVWENDGQLLNPEIQAQVGEPRKSQDLAIS